MIASESSQTVATGMLVVSKKGFQIDLSEDPITIPVVNGNRYISLHELYLSFGEIFVCKIRAYLKHLLSSYSGETAVTLIDGLHVLARASKDEKDRDFTDKVLWHFKSLADAAANKHPARKVRQWLLWDWATSASPVLNEKQVQYVREWTFKNDRPYAAIREGKDGVGPLSRSDDLNLRAALKRTDTTDQLYQELTDHQVRTILSLMRTLGLRPSQVAYTKASDLSVWEHDGRKIGTLMVPNVKDGEAPRAQFIRRRLPDDLLQMVIRSLDERSSEAVGDWLFPRRSELKTVLPAGSTEERWRIRSIDQAIKSWIRGRRLTSSDSKPLKANPLRLRYTFATELAPKLSPMELAHALGHRDERSISHYFTYGEGFFSRLSTLDGATRWGLAASSFTGLITEKRSEVGDGGPLFFGAELSFGDTPILGIGRCGATTQCRLFPPLSCYGCARFRPDPDADHASVLRTLVAWRNSRPASVGKVKDALQGQLDSVIESAGYLVGILPAFLWTRERKRQNLSRPSVLQIAEATGVPAQQIDTDRSIQTLLREWPEPSRGAQRIARRSQRNG